MTRLVLPWSCLCSVNQRTNPVRGRQFLTKRYRTALALARGEVSAQLIKAGKVIISRTICGDAQVSLEARFWRPDNRRRDVGNYMKLVEDALTGLVYDDDGQIQTWAISDEGIDRADPRVEITVEAV
jgi:Holliday junction resolvase RusA-like endonuclease